jgi:hypothetical protein
VKTVRQASRLETTSHCGTTLSLETQQDTIIPRRYRSKRISYTKRHQADIDTIMKTKEEFNAACKALGKNDPYLTELNLQEYGSLLDRERVQQVVQALEKNTIVEDLTLSENLCVHSTLQLSHFLKMSPNLQRLEMRGKEQEDKEKASIKASIVFEAISRSSMLVNLTIYDVALGDTCPCFEGFLSSTRTLQVLQFTYFRSNSTVTHSVAQAVGSGLAQNKSLVKLHWRAHRHVDFLEEILVGLYDHISLKTLVLVTQLTKSSSLALRSLLHCNGTLKCLDLTELGEIGKIPSMVAVLAGLAKNTGLKEFTFYTVSDETNATLATAWTNMLQRNKSIKMLDLRNPDYEAYAERELCSAVAKGLVANSTLETLHLPGWSSPEVFQGPVWQETLESNHCVKNLSFSGCSLSLEGFKYLAQGLSRNTSLESLDLTSTDMGDDSVIALVHGLRTNTTLKSLDLTGNCVASPSGRAAIERLMGYNVLIELILEETQESVGASILASGLSTNRSLEKLNLECTFINNEIPEPSVLFVEACAETLHSDT